MRGVGYAAWSMGDVGGVEVEAVERGLAACAVDDQLHCDGGLLPEVIDGHVVAVAVGVDGDDLGAAVEIDADVSAAGDEELDEVGIKPAQRAGAAIDDRDV